MSEKVCTLLMIARACGDDSCGIPCLKERCGQYNEYLGCCGLVAEGLLEGYAVSPKMAKDISKRIRFTP